MSLTYQLSCKQKKSTTFVMFDNSCKKDRLIIKILIRPLPYSEAILLTPAFLKYHNQQFIDDTINFNELEYMKYCIIHHANRIICIDMDTLEYITKSDKYSFNNSLLRQKVKIINKLELIENVKIKNSMKAFNGKKSFETSQLIFNTKKHGNVTVKLSLYKDPDIRNGINISVLKNLNKRTAWGGSVCASNPKNFYVKKPLTIPPIYTEHKILKINNSSYWKKKKEFIIYDDSVIERDILIPVHKK